VVIVVTVAVAAAAVTTFKINLLLAERSVTDAVDL